RRMKHQKTRLGRNARGAHPRPPQRHWRQHVRASIRCPWAICRSRRHTCPSSRGRRLPHRHRTRNRQLRHPQNAAGPALVCAPSPVSCAFPADQRLVLNLVDRWFATLTEKQIKRGAHRSTRVLEAAIREYLVISNGSAKPFLWTKTADEILAKVAGFCQSFSNSGH